MLKTGNLAAVIAVAFMATACTENMGAATGGTPQAAATKPIVAAGKNAQEVALEKDVQSLSKQTQDIIVRNTVEGALVGAALGCGLILAMGGDRDDCVRGALIGGVAGAAGGNAIGQQTAAKNNELVKQDAILANLKGVNSKLEGVTAKLDTVLKAQSTEIASLRRQVDSKQISQSQYDSRLKSINSNRKAVSDGLLTAEKNVAGSRTQLVALEKEGGTPIPSLKEAASSTEKRLATLRGTVSLIDTN